MCQPWLRDLEVGNPPLCHRPLAVFLFVFLIGLSYNLDMTQKIIAPRFVLKNSLLSEKITAKNIDDTERGVFALSDIEQGEIIAVQMGKVLSHAEYETLPFDLQRYPLQISDTAYVGLGAKANFDDIELLNHGCDPNVGIWGINVFVALRHIKENEELRYDYAMSDTTDADMGWDCTCGASICRGRITPLDWQLPALQKKYGQFFSRYILEKIKHRAM